MFNVTKSYIDKLLHCKLVHQVLQAVTKKIRSNYRKLLHRKLFHQKIASNCKIYCQTIAIRALQNIGSNLGTILHCKLYHQLAQTFAISSVKLLQSMHSTLFCQLSQSVAKPSVKLSQYAHCKILAQTREQSYIANSTVNYRINACNIFGQTIAIFAIRALHIILSTISNCCKTFGQTIAIRALHIREGFK